MASLRALELLGEGAVAKRAEEMLSLELDGPSSEVVIGALLREGGGLPTSDMPGAPSEAARFPPGAEASGRSGSTETIEPLRRPAEADLIVELDP